MGSVKKIYIIELFYLEKINSFVLSVCVFIIEDGVNWREMPMNTVQIQPWADLYGDLCRLLKFCMNPTRPDPTF